MCTTVQYFFSCGHPATHRFRNSICAISFSRACRIRDMDSWLRFPCRRCTVQRLAVGIKIRTRPDSDDQGYNDIWHIPSRCFVDVGFRTLDPFRDDISPPVSPNSPAPSLTSPLTQKPTSRWSHFPKDDRNKCAKLIAKVMRFKKLSPCCENRARRGAFPAVRLEGPENRINGLVMEDHCESLQ